MKEIPSAHCGMVAILGRPNVGKSTFLNRVLGQKISITSRKPQTTRQQILGIKTVGYSQIVYVDTPGLQANPKHALARFMNREAARVLGVVDLVLLMVEALKWTDGDDHVVRMIYGASIPVILAVNKVDRVRNKARLLPFLDKVQAARDFVQIVPIAARNGHNLARLEQAIINLLPVGRPMFAKDQVTDRSVRFLAAEIVREKLMRRLGYEVPYRLTVRVDEFKAGADVVHISTTIWVESEGQKGIVIGNRGTVLRDIGTQARREIEHMLGQRVFLETWVKVKKNWSDDALALRQLGYQDPERRALEL